MIHSKYVRFFVSLLFISLGAVSCDKSDKCGQRGDPCGSGHGVYATKPVVADGEDPCVCRCQGNWEWDANAADCVCNLTQSDCPEYTKLDPADCECLPGLGSLQAMLSGSQVNGTISFTPATVQGKFDTIDSTFVLHTYNVKGQEYLEFRIPYAGVGSFNTDVNTSLAEFTAIHQLQQDSAPFTVETGEVIINQYEWYTEATGTFSMTLTGPQGNRTFTNGEFNFRFPQ